MVPSSIVKSIIKNARTGTRSDSSEKEKNSLWGIWETFIPFPIPIPPEHTAATALDATDARTSFNLWPICPPSVKCLCSGEAISMLANRGRDTCGKIFPTEFFSVFKWEATKDQHFPSTDQFCCCVPFPGCLVRLPATKRCPLIAKSCNQSLPLLFVWPTPSHQPPVVITSWDQIPIEILHSDFWSANRAWKHTFGDLLALGWLFCPSFPWSIEIHFCPIESDLLCTRISIEDDGNHIQALEKENLAQFCLDKMLA